MRTFQCAHLLHTPPAFRPVYGLLAVRHATPAHVAVTRAGVTRVVRYLQAVIRSTLHKPITTEQQVHQSVCKLVFHFVTCHLGVATSAATTSAAVQHTIWSHIDS